MDKTLPALPLLALALALALGACGNKGPLVRMPDEQPPPVPVGETLPDTTPPEQVPATEALQSPAEDQNDEAIAPPVDTGDDGG